MCLSGLVDFNGKGLYCMHNAMSSILYFSYIPVISSQILSSEELLTEDVQGRRKKGWNKKRECKKLVSVIYMKFRFHPRSQVLFTAISAFFAFFTLHKICFTQVYGTLRQGARAYYLPV